MDQYSQKEENTFRENLSKRMDNQDFMLGKILEQTTRTNGRVTVLEVTTKDYETYKATVSSLSGWKMWLTGAVAVIIFGGGFVWNLMLNNILVIAKENTQTLIDKSIDQTADRVMTSIETKYDLQILKVK